MCGQRLSSRGPIPASRSVLSHLFSHNSELARFAVRVACVCRAVGSAGHRVSCLDMACLMSQCVISQCVMSQCFISQCIMSHCVISECLMSLRV